MMGTQVNRDARNIMGLIKKDSVGAEIGVWYGNSSKEFLKRGVKELHLIDAWSIEPYKESDEHGTYENYLERYSKMCGGGTEKDFQQYYDRVYEEVSTGVGADKRVTIHRMSSDEWFETFTERKLDWIYVDGDHSYEGCLRDLRNSLKVVKWGGLILGDDYKWGDTRWGKDGVTRAVDEFCRTEGLFKKRHGDIQFSIGV